MFRACLIDSRMTVVLGFWTFPSKQNLTGTYIKSDVVNVCATERFINRIFFGSWTKRQANTLDVEINELYVLQSFSGV